MPIARCSLRCGSSNAFRPQAALWNLFLEQQQPLNLPNARRLSLRHRSLQDAQSAVEISPNSEKRSGNPASIPPSEYINTASLRGSLQALRAKNRDKFLGQDIPSSDNTYSNGNAHAIPITRVPYGPKLSSQKRPKDTFSERNEVDILFEGRQFDLNKFSFPQQKNFERPSFEESHNGPSKGKAEIIAKNKTTHNEAELLEYEGLYVRPSMGEAKSNHDFPWTKDIPSEIYGRKRLDAEVLGFLEYIKPTPAEEAATSAVTQGIRNAIKKYLPHHESEVFGSQKTGLVLATSDIDIRLYDPRNKDSETAPRYFRRREMSAHLWKLHQRLHLNNNEYMMVRLRHARYPLISLMHKKSGLDIQIVASNDSSNSRQIIKQYMDEHPNLYAVFALIKSMLDIRGLTDVYRGGLGSYSLFMMIMAVLKMGPYTGTQTLAGSQLMTVLEFYTKLDTYKRGLTLHPPYSVAKHKLDSPLSAEQESEVGELPYLKGLQKLTLIDPMQPYLLCLQDPADPLNDLGRKGYGYKHIQATFKYLEEEIRREATQSTQQGWKGSILGRAVGPCFKAYETRRAITEAYGQEILDKQRAEKEAEEKAAEKKAVEAETADI